MKEAVVKQLVCSVVLEPPTSLSARHVGGSRVFPSSSFIVISTNMSTHQLVEKPELLYIPTAYEQPIMRALTHQFLAIGGSRSSARQLMLIGWLGMRWSLTSGVIMTPGDAGNVFNQQP